MTRIELEAPAPTQDVNNITIPDGSVGRNYFYTSLARTSSRKSLNLEPNTQYIISTSLPQRDDGGAHLFVGTEGFTMSTPTNGVYDGKNVLVTTTREGIIEIQFAQWLYTWITDGEHHIQIEKGNKATDWKPAPEDTDGEEVKGVIYTINGEPVTGTIKITEDTTIQAVAEEGYQIIGDNEWTFEYQPTIATVRETRYELIPQPETEYQETDEVFIGGERTIQEGHPGEYTIVERVRYEDGVEVSREQLSKEITTEPKPAIIEVSTHRPTGKEIYLYQTEDPDTTINKDLDLISVTEIELKDPNNVTSPSIVLEEIPDVNLKTINYAYISEFMRYYFVRHLNVGPNNVYQLMLECDVLETFKDEILNSSAEITRSIQTDDYGDIVPSAEVRKEVDVFESDKGFKTGEQSIIFSTIGKEVT